jgi:hypothetical protein
MKNLGYYYRAHKKYFTAVLVIVVIYGLIWAFYGFEYITATHQILAKYGTVGPPCVPGPGLLGEKGTFSISPTNNLLPLKGVGYIISTSNGGVAEGSVTPWGGVKEAYRSAGCGLV